MKALLALISFFAVVSNSWSAVDLGNRSSGTPYDRYMAPVRTVLGALDNRKANMEQVKALMKEGRSFRYRFDEPYVPAMPSVTASQRTGDCKDKALWLCDRLNDASVRFVIGKTHARAKMSHAWVMWQNEGRWWILDCTLKSAPIAADTLPSDKYIPQYSYAKGTAFRHGVTNMNVASVATKGKAPVAAARLRR
jgi:transglutaminase-like putative cysteine protease